MVIPVRPYLPACSRAGVEPRDDLAAAFPYTRARALAEYIVPEKERKREGGRKRAKEKERQVPWSVARQTERIVRARACRVCVCVRRATPLRVKAENPTRYKNKILNRRQLRACPREKWERDDGLISAESLVSKFRAFECRLFTFLNEWRARRTERGECLFLSSLIYLFQNCKFFFHSICLLLLKTGTSRTDCVD